MSDHQFIVTDIDYQPYKDENEIPSAIKPEDIKEESIFLLTQADIAEFANQATNNIQVIEDLTSSSNSVQDNSPFTLQQFDAQVNQVLSGNNFTKLPLDLGPSFKLEDFKSDRALPHYVKYRVQDGKHMKVWECGICSKEFGHQYTLMRHLPTHTDERKFQCNTCGKAFRQMSTLSQHRAIHSAERPYVCEVCHKTFNRVSTLISHRKTHTGQKPHQCHLCNKAFHQKGNLRNHIFTHTNERPYKCDICNKGFNQMSNLMCHKLKAHQRSDKPRYTCQVCGKEFQKRMGLRNHEQYQHGMQNAEASTSSDAPRIRYTNGVIVDPINTAAMQLALATNQTPFALLRPLNGIPVLVRVLPAGDKQMLVPATAEDLKKHGQISINPKTTDEANGEDKKEKAPEATENDVTIKQELKGKAAGSTVQIKIPVVATVIQRCGKDGNLCMAVQSPGPTEGSGSDTYVLSTTENGNSTITSSHGCDGNKNGDGGGEENLNDAGMLLQESHIEFLDESGNVISADDFNKANQYFNQNFCIGSEQETYTENLNLENGIPLPENKENIVQNVFKDLSNEDMLEVDNNMQIYQMLTKPQDINLTNSDSVLDGANMLYNGNGSFVL